MALDLDTKPKLKFLLCQTTGTTRGGCHDFRRSSLEQTRTRILCVQVRKRPVRDSLDAVLRSLTPAMWNRPNDTDR